MQTQDTRRETMRFCAGSEYRPGPLRGGSVTLMWRQPSSGANSMNGLAVVALVLVIERPPVPMDRDLGARGG
jgi:hypothetical protein